MSDDVPALGHPQDHGEPDGDPLDLTTLYEQLGNRLADVRENFQDMHPQDVAEVLRNCELTALQLAREIRARRTWVLEEVLPDWEVAQRGMGPRMPPADQAQTAAPQVDGVAGFRVVPPGGRPPGAGGVGAGERKKITLPLDSPSPRPEL